MSVPLSFDPMANLFENGINIAEIPEDVGHSRQLLRWSTYGLANPHELISSASEALNISTIQQLHIGKFAALGVVVPLRPGHTFIGGAPDDSSHIAVYNLVDYIEAEPLELPAEHNKKQYQMLNTVWQSYWSWIKDTRQTYYLSDLSKNDAWGYAMGKLVLFDVEPLFSVTGHAG